jgi:hypothetical protein
VKISCDALMSRDGRYRYSLGRHWNPSKPACLFIMLNPSTADARKNDRTVTRCLAFAKSWGYGGFYVANLFAYRTSKPSEMKRAANPVGAKNRIHLERLAKKVKRSGGVCIAAWGRHGSHNNQDKIVVSRFKKLGIGLYFLALTKDGFPKHPLYLRGDLHPTGWTSQRT